MISFILIYHKELKDSNNMTIYDPKFWRWQVEERLTVLKQELNVMGLDVPTKQDLQKRIIMLENELKQIDKEDEEHGTQWYDEETGSAADM
tara:strand:+ start:133 stop:405 length:273 start_codon:yes stop_codon:yes gene_type:complete